MNFFFTRTWKACINKPGLLHTPALSQGTAGALPLCWAGHLSAACRAGSWGSRMHQSCPGRLYQGLGLAAGSAGRKCSCWQTEMLLRTPAFGGRGPDQLPPADPQPQTPPCDKTGTTGRAPGWGSLLNRNLKYVISAHTWEIRVA